MLLKVILLDLFGRDFIVHNWVRTLTENSAVLAMFSVAKSCDPETREYKKLSWCGQTRVMHLEVSQGHQTQYHSMLDIFPLVQ